MKRTWFVCTLFIGLMFGLSAVGSAQTNFSGTWELDKAKSEMLGRQLENAKSYALVITQDGKQVTVETKLERGENPGGGGGRGGGGGFGGGGAAGPMTYKLDGETTMDTQGGKVTLTAKWADGGKVLQLTSVRNVNFQGNEMTITTKERWELADGGKTLKLHRTTETQRGPQEVKITLVKK
jgi:hypothetical protein